MATTVGSHSVAAFTSPVNGTTPIDANTVRGNDNTMRTAYVDHDADPGIHVQSSTLASRPAAGTAGRKWITEDSGVYTLWFDDGSNWHPVSSENVALTVLAGETLAKGDVVKVTGWNNGQDLPEVVKTTSATDTAFAIMTAAATINTMGYATNTGIVQDLNTNSFNVGDVLYPNGSGGFTSTKPTSGTYQVAGYVLRKNSSNGVIFVEFSGPRIVEASANTASTVVLRDASGNFSAGTITAGAVTSTGLVTFASLKGTGATTVTNILDEDNMASDSATALATQQSIKAYVDAKVATVDTLAEVLANGNTTGANNIIVSSGQKITTNTIDETTSGSGVTIDSVLLKDDVVNATDIETGTVSANDGTLAITIANSTGALTLNTALADSNLATISTAGKVSNSATTATSANTASAIVARDASGNFTAGTITASLTGSISGNAATATALQTARNINGVSFNGTADITVTADAGTLTGSTLASGVTASSLTSVGTLSSLTVSGNTSLASSSGGVGIGVAAGSSKLNVAGTLTKNTGDENTWGIRVTDDTTMAAGVGGGLVFVGNYTSGGAKASFASIAGAKANSTTANGLGELRFYTTDVSSVLQQRAVIDGAGNLAVDTNTLYVDATNNRVGIGTASPGTTLHATATGGTFSSPLGNVIARFNATTNTAGQGAGIALTALATKETAWVIAAEHTSGNNGDLTFYGYQGGATYAELMRMSNAGNLGIGTTSPSGTGTTIEVKGATGDATMKVTGNTGGNAYLQLNAGSSGNAYINSVGSGALIFGANGVASSHARITSGGSLLVGTTNNSASATVVAGINSATANAAFIGLENDSSGANDWAITIGSAVNNLGFRNVSGSYTALEFENGTGAANVCINGVSTGNGEGVVFIKNRVTAPSANPTNGGILYVESGALKYRGSSGTVTTIANA